MAAQQQEPITDIRLKLVGEDGNAFNEKTFVMESFSFNPNAWRTPFALLFT